MSARFSAPLARLALPLALLAALGHGCQGEKGQKGDPGAPAGSGLPAISNVTLSPTSAIQGAGGGTVTVHFAVDVTDDGADLTSLGAAVATVTDGTAAVFSTARTVTPGESSLLYSGAVEVPTGAAGTFTIDFSAQDAAGHTATSHALFTVEPSRPVLQALSPSSGGMGDAPLQITVTGSGFDEGSTVYWSSLELPTTRVDAGTLLATASASQFYLVGAWPVWVRDSAGRTSEVLYFRVTATPPPPPPAAPTLTSISPTHVEQGSATFTLTATGSGFDASTVLLFGGNWLSTTLVDPTQVTAAISSYQLLSAGTVQVTARNGTSAPSAALDFTIDPPAPRPLPVLTGLSPASADAGSGELQVTLTGSGFHRTSNVQAGGYYMLTPTFVSESELRVTVPAYLLATPGSFTLSVQTPTPGGGSSTALSFQVRLPAIPGLTTVRISARDMVWEPYGQRLYLSVGSTSPASPNSVAVLDPFTGTVESTVFAGSEPGPLALSDDGRFLYVGHGGASEVTRFALPALTEDLAIPLGRDATSGAYTAAALAVAPGAPRTVAVALSAGYTQATALFDDAAPRADRGATSGALAFGADASRLYSLGGYYGDLSVTPVTASGLGTATVYRSAFSSNAGLKYDPGTQLLYGADGRAVDPATGGLAGTFAAASGYWYSTSVAPDSSLGAVYFASSGGSSTWLSIQPYDIERYVARSATELRYHSGPVSRLVRWGPDGLAVATADRVELLRGPAVLPAATSDNPAPTLVTLSPASVAAGSGNLRLTVAGTGFVPGAVVRVDGTDRFTRRVSASQLVAYVPAIALATAGDLSVTVVNPAPGGGTSGAMTLTVTP